MIDALEGEYYTKLLDNNLLPPATGLGYNLRVFINHQKETRKMTKMTVAGIVGIAAIAAGCRCHAAEEASAFIANHGRGWEIDTNNFDDRVPSLDAWFAALDALDLPPSRLLAY